MTVIRVPKTPASAINPDRPISGLLKNQILHLQHAEFRLPARDQTNIYVNKIRTEREAAEYIRQVTAKIHPEATGGGRAKTRVIPTITAVGKRKPGKKSAAKPKSKSKSKSTGRVARKRK
jgi:hypothetical protein